MKDEYALYLKHIDSISLSDMSKKDLQNLIAMGEGSFLEFKQRIASPEKIAREIAAFANTKGGTILIGVDDKGEIIGLEGYLEEEFWLNQAVNELCIPPVKINIELLHTGKKDVLIVKVPEAEEKPVYIKRKKKRLVLIRVGDENVEASEERIEIMKNSSSSDGVTFEYGENEKSLFRFLNEYSDITVERFSRLIHVTTFRASRILIDLVSAGVLDVFVKDGIEHYTFSNKSA
jgi:predicted HTH transcriptional regulator